MVKHGPEKEKLNSMVLNFQEFSVRYFGDPANGALE